MPKTPKQPVAPLTPDQKAQLADLYVVHGLDPREIAERMGLDESAVTRAIRSDQRLVNQRAEVDADPGVLRAFRAETGRLAELRQVIRVQCADLETIRMRAQIATARKLERMADEAEAPRDVAAVARSLGPASQDVTAARLSVDLNTSKVEQTVDAVERITAVFERAGFIEPEPRACPDAGGDGEVVRGDRVDTAPGPVEGDQGG